MVTETGFNHAKEGWLSAAKTARGAKEHCQRTYEEDKELGLIGDEPFEKWAEMNVRARVVSRLNRELMTSLLGTGIHEGLSAI